MVLSQPVDRAMVDHAISVCKNSARRLKVCRQARCNATVNIKSIRAVIIANAKLHQCLAKIAPGRSRFSGLKVRPLQSKFRHASSLLCPVTQR